MRAVFLRRAERDDVFPCLNPLQPILHGGEPKTQISFLYCSQRKIVKTDARLYVGMAGLKPTLFCRKRQRQRQRVGQAAAQQRRFSAGLIMLLSSSAASCGVNRRSISTPTGRSAITASARWPQ